MFDTVTVPGFAMAGAAFAGIAAALRARDPSKVRTAVRIVVVLQRLFVIAPEGSQGADEDRLYALCIGVMSWAGLLGISCIEQMSFVSSAEAAPCCSGRCRL